MLHRIASHIMEIQNPQPQANKYKVLHSALESGYRIGFDVLYYSSLLDDELMEDIGEKEGELIREYRPILNYQIPKQGDYKHWTANKRAKEVVLGDIVHS